ncbi:MAG TPA: hypothetical protein PK523_01760 [Elusimicrobiales bacterium]|nr:hypothetical protein [Elusimicrobiales bacterium]
MLSPERITKKGLAALLTALLSSAAAAQWGALPAGTFAEPSFSLSGGDLHPRRSGLGTAVSLGRSGDYDFNFSGGLEHIRTSGHGYFPGELYKASLGLAAVNGGISFSLGARSDSDRPYNSSSETDLGFNFTKELGANGARGVWLAGLNYSSRRSFLRGLPVPFLSYRYVSDEWTFFAPFMAQWRPGGDMSYSFRWRPVKYFSLAAAWRPPGPFGAELEGGVGLEQFLLADRPDTGDSLYLETPYLVFRPTMRLPGRLTLTAEAGWHFDGRYYTGRKYDDYGLSADIDGGAFAGLALKKAFGAAPAGRGRPGRPQN